MAKAVFAVDFGVLWIFAAQSGYSMLLDARKCWAAVDWQRPLRACDWAVPW